MAPQKRNNRKIRARGEERRFTVRSIRRDPPDLGKLGKALIHLAVAEAERQAQAQAQAEQSAHTEQTESASADEGRTRE